MAAAGAGLLPVVRDEHVGVLISSVLYRPIVDSISALSRASPTVPIEASIPASIRWGHEPRLLVVRGRMLDPVDDCDDGHAQQHDSQQRVEVVRACEAHSGNSLSAGRVEGGRNLVDRRLLRLADVLAVLAVGSCHFVRQVDDELAVLLHLYRRGLAL